MPLLRSRTVRILTLALSLAAATAACGPAANALPTALPGAGGSCPVRRRVPTRPAPLPSGALTDPAEAWPAFAACLRAHGANIADPVLDKNGDPQWAGEIKQYMTEPVRAACQPILAATRRPGATSRNRATFTFESELANAACMRDARLPDLARSDLDDRRGQHAGGVRQGGSGRPGGARSRASRSSSRRRRRRRRGCDAPPPAGRRDRRSGRRGRGHRGRRPDLAAARLAAGVRGGHGQRHAVGRGQGRSGARDAAGRGHPDDPRGQPAGVRHGHLDRVVDDRAADRCDPGRGRRGRGRRRRRERPADRGPNRASPPPRGHGRSSRPGTTRRSAPARLARPGARPSEPDRSIGSTRIARSRRPGRRSPTRSVPLPRPPATWPPGARPKRRLAGRSPACRRSGRPWPAARPLYALDGRPTVLLIGTVPGVSSAARGRYAAGRRPAPGEPRRPRRRRITGAPDRRDVRSRHDPGGPALADDAPCRGNRYRPARRRDRPPCGRPRGQRARRGRWGRPARRADARPHVGRRDRQARGRPAARAVHPPRRPDPVHRPPTGRRSRARS